MKKNDLNEKKTSKRAAEVLTEVKPDELQSVTGGSCRTCGLIVTAS